MLDITPESQMCFWFALVTIFIIRNRRFNWLTFVLYVILCGSLWQMQVHSQAEDTFNRKSVMAECTEVACRTLDTNTRTEHDCDYTFTWEDMVFKRQINGKYPSWSRGDTLDLELVKLNNGTQLLRVPQDTLDLPFELASWAFGISLTLMLLTF